MLGDFTQRDEIQTPIPSANTKLPHQEFSIPDIMDQVSTIEQYLVQEVPFDSSELQINMGKDSNLIFLEENSIKFWSLRGKKIVNEITQFEMVELIKSTVYFLIIQISSFRYQILDPFSFTKLFEVQGKARLCECTSTKDVILITESNGQIIAIDFTNNKDIHVQTYSPQDKQLREVFTKLSISNDGKTFCAFEMKSKNAVVFGVQPLHEIWREELIVDQEDLQDIQKLMTISDDNLYICLRNSVKKGVNYYSMTDSTLILSIESMHVNPINQILNWNNGKKIITCSKDKKIKIWNLSTKQLDLSFPPQHLSSVEALVLSNNQKFMFSCSLDMTVGVWCMKRFKLLAQLNSTIKINDLQFSDDQSYLVAFGEKSKIQYWKLEENSESVKIGIDISYLNECIVTPNGEYVVTTNLSKMLMEIWSTLTKSCRESGELIRWSTKTQADTGIYSHSDDIIDIVIDTNDKFIYTMGYTKGKFYKWEVESMTQILVLDLGVDLKTDQIVSKIGNLDYSPGTISITLDSQFAVVCQGWNSSKVFVLYLETLQTFKILEDHKETGVWFVAPTPDGLYVITRNYQETIIWDAKTFNYILFVDEKFIMLLSDHKICRAFLHDGFFKLWSAKTAAQLSDDFPQSQENMIGEGDEQKSLLKISGPFNSLVPLIIKNLMQTVKSEQRQYVKALQDNFILPYKLNILHFFAFYNNPHSLTSALDQGTIYTRDYLGKSPLEYSIDRMSQECTDILLGYIMKRENIYQKMKEQELIKLVNFGPSNLLQFFENAVFTEEKNVPPYGSIVGGNCTFLLTKGAILENYDCKLMLNSKIPESQQKPLLFKSLKIKYNLEPGSLSSIILHQSLQDTNSKEIFTSEAVNRILEYKWNKVKQFAYIQCSVYFLFVALIIAHSISYKDRIELVIAILAFGFIFIGWELFQLILNYRSYFGEIWNVLDIGRVILIVWYCLTALVNISNDKSAVDKENRIVLGVLNLLVFLRILSYFRLNQSSRVLIRLIIEVCRDMVSFTLLLFLSIVGFAITFNIIQSNDSDEDTLRGNLGLYYRLIYGDFGMIADDTGTALWIVFIGSSFFITLIMMNLLIAIMSDTYDRVMNDITSTDGWELNQLILEQESMMFWKRNKGEPMYLHWVTYTGGSSQSLWEGRIAAIHQSLQQEQGSLSEDVKTIVKELSDIKSQLQSHSRDVNMRFEEHRKKLEKIRSFHPQKSILI
ncbi:wd-40 repeat protein [Stylonychia lemnae]|uniref:Wd-40 repeat protein n=1 Tax=Stylonychia lemnae TaxID=5949 RepID=A0A077ZZ51_STYLE|nr:wd-40 repeat protein [Stylonychia lemnae]|eukprot:CDW74847.1 wd-40 repeat protein [Stylonychia lemnae]